MVTSTESELLRAGVSLSRVESWFKREQIIKTRTREQTWSLDQFKWHFCNSGVLEILVRTTGQPPAPTGPLPAPTTGPPPDHRRCTTCTHRHIGPLMHHRRTTAVPPPDHHNDYDSISEIRMTQIYDADAEADEEMLTLMSV
ncbi:hypothetical protein LXL04_014702 [Taraxacum kok-saghyz]